MNQLELINICATKFETEWLSQTEIEWPNVAFTHTTVPYVRFSVAVTDARNGTIGINSPTKFAGYIIGQVFVKTNSGYKQAYDLAQSILAIFQNAQFSGVLTYAGEIIEVGVDPEDSNLFQVNAQIPFDAM